MVVCIVFNHVQSNEHILKKDEALGFRTRLKKKKHRLGSFNEKPKERQYKRGVGCLENSLEISYIVYIYMYIYKFDSIGPSVVGNQSKPM